MRPRSTPLLRATSFNPRALHPTPNGARSFSQGVQTNPLRSGLRRPFLFSQHSERLLQQQRCITQNYIKRMEDGKKEWAKHAVEIRAGKRKSFVAHLEERGLIHDVVGYVCQAMHHEHLRRHIIHLRDEY
jgi:tyrosyl-tRNA synthetase